MTSTFKYRRTDLVRQAYDPAATTDPIYFYDAAGEAFLRLDEALYNRIQSGRIDWRNRPKHVCSGAVDSGELNHSPSRAM
jgi:hypothetical protein